MASSVFTAVIDEMTGATSSTPGIAGLVPAPAAGDEDKVLKGDGTWGEVQNSGGTLRVVPFSIGASSWTLVNGIYTSTFATEYVTASSVEFVEYTDSFRNVIRGDLSWTKTSGGGGVTFRTDVIPSGTLVGEIRIIDRDDNKVAIVTQQTAWPTMREVPFTIYVSDWTANGNGKYEAVFESPFITETSHDFVEFDESIENATDGIKAIKAERTGATVGMKFVSRRVPAGNISGTITPLDNADGKVVVALQDTVISIANGGTGANTFQGAQDALGITELRNYIIAFNRRILIYSGSLNENIFTFTESLSDYNAVEIRITYTYGFANEVLKVLTDVLSETSNQFHYGTGYFNLFRDTDNSMHFGNINMSNVSKIEVWLTEHK